MTLTRRHSIVLPTLAALSAACEQLGIKAKIVTSTTVNGQTTVKEREAKNWDEFEEAMGEVATDFSSFAKEVGATTAALIEKLTEVPPAGQVRLGVLDPTLAPLEGDIRYDYLKVATSKPDPEYDFKYVQIGMPEYDTFFRTAAEMYGTAYQLVETGRHIHLAASELGGANADAAVQGGQKTVPKADVDHGLADLKAAQQPQVAEAAERFGILWGSVASLGAGLVSRTAQLVQTGTALVASAPAQITNPKLVLHLDLIVKGLSQSVELVGNTGTLLASAVG